MVQTLYVRYLTSVVQKILLKILKDKSYVEIFDGENEKLREFFDDLTMG